MLEKYKEIKLSDEWIAFDKYYNGPNFMRQLGFFRYEDSNTNFLASVLDIKNIYGLDDFPLKLFLKLISKKSKDFSVFSENDNYKISDFYIEKQLKVKSGVLDLFIEFKINTVLYLIVLEAKLFSVEHDEQCRKYKEDFDTAEKYKDYKKIYVYLSLDNNDVISSDGYLKINYQELIDNVYTPCSFKMENRQLVLSIDEYLRSFSLFYEEEWLDVRLIPITYMGKKLTIDLWNRYCDVLSLLVEKDYKDLYNDGKDVLRIFYINVLNISDELRISQSLKGKISLCINPTIHKNRFDDKWYGNNEFLYRVLYDIVENKKIEKFEDFPNDLIITTGNWRNLIADSEIDMEPRKDYYRLNKNGCLPIVIGGEKYWYCDWNNGRDIKRLIAAVRKCYPGDYDNRLFRNDD